MPDRPVNRPVDLPVDEAIAFIAEHPNVFLLAHRSDGWPTGYPMLARTGDGVVEFSTYRASAKVRNILRDGRASVVTAAFGTDDPRVVVVSGPVTAVERAAWASASGDGPPGAPVVVPAAVSERVNARHESGKRVVLRLTVERARSSSRAVG